MNLKWLIFFLLFLYPLFFCTQTNKIIQKYIDSLNIIQDENRKTDILILLSEETQNTSFSESYGYAKQAIELAEKNRYLKGMVEAYDAIADAYWYHTDYAKAQTYYFKSYRINDSLKDEKGIANSLYNLGWIICIQQKKYNEINYLYKSLNTFKKINDTDGVLRLYNALGNVYNDMYAHKSTQLYFDSAMHYYNLGLDILKTYSNPNRMAVFYSNIGELLALSDNYHEAIKYAEKAVPYYVSQSDSVGYYLNRTNVANYNLNLKQYDKAIELLKTALSFCKRNDNREILIYVYRYLHQAYKVTGKTDLAYESLFNYMALNDSATSQIYSSNVKELQNSYELEKKEASIRQLTQENEIQELKAKQNKFILLGGSIILLIIVFIAYLLFKRNREKSIVNFQLKEQNVIITQKKQEIESSIHYAKGIQTSFFPDPSELKIVFPDTFIFYRPKDVVSGDFYWFDRVGDSFYCVAADCTGHGVPGALMSIVSVDKITQAIFEKKLSEPSQILSFLNVEIKKALKQHDEDANQQKDGLDIALLKFNLTSNTVDYSAANRQLLIVNDTEINEYRPDKVAIAGFTPDHYEFSQTRILLKKGDNVYIFSDGYVDQFGGESGKKYMIKNFKNLLLAIADKDMHTQEREILAAHHNWKGSYEQVDDILVIGIKI